MAVFRGFFTKTCCFFLLICVGLTCSCNNQNENPTLSPTDPAEETVTPVSGDVLLDDGWEDIKGSGVFSLTAAPGSCGADASRLIKDQIDGDWYLHTYLAYSSADSEGDNHVGLTLYKDENNYLIWGPRNGGNSVLSVKSSGELSDGLIISDNSYKHLRIIKSTIDADCTRYYFYTANDAYYSWVSCGYWDDKSGIFENAQYGILALDYNKESKKPFCAEFEFVSDYTMYINKDFFVGEKGSLDSRWISGVENATAKNYSLYLNQASLLKNAYTEDWTIEAMINSEKNDASVFSALCACGDSGKAEIGFQSGCVIAKSNGEEIGRLDGDYLFLKIILSDGVLSFKTSKTGGSWETLASCENKLGNKVMYGLSADGGQGVFK